MTEPPATNVITIDGHAIEYRLQRRGGAAVLILHGGHMSACCRFGEEVFLETGYTVLVTSRPGYGRTGVGAGPSAPEFAVRLADLCRRLELKEVTVVGISIGARTALTMAAFYPDLVPNVILMCPNKLPPVAGSSRPPHRVCGLRAGRPASDLGNAAPAAPNGFRQTPAGHSGEPDNPRRRGGRTKARVRRSEDEGVPAELPIR